MTCKNHNCQCGGNAGQEFAELAPVLDKYAKVPGSLITIPVLYTLLNMIM